MNFIPMGDRVLVEVLAETVSGLIIIPETEDLPQRKGIVVALPENKEITSNLVLGDKVMFENMAVDVALDGKDYKLVHIEYIQGKLI